jgi:hypothetical protein
MFNIGHARPAESHLPLGGTPREGGGWQPLE